MYLGYQSFRCCESSEMLAVLGFGFSFLGARREVAKLAMAGFGVCRRWSRHRGGDLAFCGVRLLEWAGASSRLRLCLCLWPGPRRLHGGHLHCCLLGFQAPPPPCRRLLCLHEVGQSHQDRTRGPCYRRLRWGHDSTTALQLPTECWRIATPLCCYSSAASGLARELS